MERSVWGDVSIEEMIEKLHKDCQEEMAVVLENRRKLERVGFCLAQVRQDHVTSKTQAHAEGTDEHWQHMLDLNRARVKRLQKTLVAVQELEKNMSSLQSWLVQVEIKLSDPITYHTCESQEIQRKLTEQQDIQRDIMEHTVGMESVLSLCEAMLQECDMYDTDTQFSSVLQASRTLEQRWRNVQAASSQRIKQIEETAILWEKFMDDVSCFDDWLQTSERTAALSSSSGLLYTTAKKELKKFEALEQEVQGNVTQLDIIIKQYQHLVLEDCTDDSCQLWNMMFEGKQRWEALNDKVVSGLHRLKELIGEREVFESARDAVLMWVTAIDLQLTNLEHFSQCDEQDIFSQFQALQQEISLNAGKIEDTIHQGELLIQRNEPHDAAVIEEECEELHRYCKAVFGRVHRYQEKFNGLLITTDELGLSDLEYSEELLCMQVEDSGRGSPASVDSIPLEWDHEYDLSHNSAFHSDDVGSLDSYVQQPLSHLYLTDWSDFASLCSSETTEQASTEELCMKYELNEGQEYSFHDQQRLRVGIDLAEAELDQLKGWDLRVNSQTTELCIRRLKQIHLELKELQLKANLPGDLSNQLQTQIKSRNCLEAEETEQQMSDRLEWLLKELTRVIGELQQAVGSEPQCKSSPTQPEPTVNTEQPRFHRGDGSTSSQSESQRQAFLWRVLWTTLPIQFFLLLLIGLAFLVPPIQEDHSYVLANVLVQNLHPTLCYTHGPPPV